jgi:hypothetical protein
MKAAVQNAQGIKAEIPWDLRSKARGIGADSPVFGAGL